MSAHLWSIRQDQRGLWCVHAPDGELRVVRDSFGSAVYDVRVALGGAGGPYVVVGHGRAPVQVASPAGSARPGDPLPSVPGVWERVEPAASEAAGVVDGLTGREAPADPFEKLKEVEVSKIVPRKVRDSREFKEINQSVAAGATALAFVALVLGNGTAAAVTSSVTVALRAETTVGSYLTFGQAFFLTLALSASAAFFTYLTYEGQMKSYGALGLWVLVTLAIAGVSQAMGFAGPSASDLAEVAGGSSPVLAFVRVLTAFLEFYTLVPFLGGLITGFLTGRVIARLGRPVAQPA